MLQCPLEGEQGSVCGEVELDLESARWPALLLLGVGVGAFGTLIGVGGGFLLVPLLLVLYPDEPPYVITSISLAVVAINAASGSIAYARLGRIDYRTGGLFALTGVPGSILGVLTTRLLPRGIFDFLFGILLVALALYLVLMPRRPEGVRPQRRINWRLAALLSFGLGFAAGLFGIGGGFLQVPMLVHVFGFDSHVAAATSQFTLVFTASAGTLTHLVAGEFERGLRRVLALGLGVVIGAQFGARLAQRLHGRWIQRLLAGTLLVVGLRLILSGLLS